MLRVFENEVQMLFFFVLKGMRTGWRRRLSEEVEMNRAFSQNGRSAFKMLKGKSKKGGSLVGVDGMQLRIRIMVTVDNPAFNLQTL